MYKNIEIQKIRLRKSITFIVIRYVTLFLNAVRGFYLASTVGPKGYGIYALVCLAYQQCSVLGFGLREGVTLRLSGISPNDKYFSDNLSNILSFTFITSILLLILSVPVYLFRNYLSQIHDVMYYSSVVLQLASITINCEILANTQRVLGNVLKVGLTELSYAILCFISIIIVTYFGFDIGTLFYYMLIINVIVLLYYLSLVSTIVKFQLNKNLIYSLLITSTPLLLLNTQMLLMQTMGQWFVGSYSNATQIGIYSFGASIAIVAGNGMSSISWAYFSEALGVFKNSENLEVLKIYLNKIHKYIELMFYLTALIIGLIFPALIDIYFPNYEGADLVFIPLMFSLLFQNLIFGDTALLMSKNRIKSLIYSSLACLILILILCVYAFNSNVSNHIGINLLQLIAIIVLSVNIVFTILVILLTTSYLHSGFYKKLVFLIRTISFTIIFILCNQYNILTYFSLTAFFLILPIYRNEIILITKKMLNKINIKQNQ